MNKENSHDVDSNRESRSAKSLVSGRERCLADETAGPETKVRFMYRERRSGQKVAFTESECPDNSVDSGWRFVCGTNRSAVPIVIYALSTVADWNPEIIPLLDSTIPSAFEREGGSGRFVEVHGFDPPEIC
jgi:hypothetical protein